MVLDSFHPAVAAWFRRRFEAPTGAQERAWPAIRSGRHTLIAAPTGSGKTLAAFLAAIDDLVRLGLEGPLADETHVVYVSPLKALSNDIQKNLQEPLAGIEEELERAGLPRVPVRVLVRTGDTPASERAAMVRRPPHILVSTPESLYILLTSESGRRMLRTARTIIVDEIHAVADDRRGAHLALSLERLEALTVRPPVRIGLSATQKPIEEVARFLVGTPRVSPDGAPDCTIVNEGHSRALDLGIEVPGSPLQAVMSHDVWKELYDRIAELVRGHRTTLVFVNTRRLAERIARHLAERIGEENVTSHHGSLSRAHRLDSERRLKEGSLRALVATASLELGIDIGSVELVCQIGSPRSIAALLQRVGRSGHRIGEFPKGRIFPTSRDDLVECAALLDAVRRGELDALTIPKGPLDVLAQQIVASVAAEEWGEDDLFAVARRAWPYRELARSDFDALVRMLASGYTTRRGRRGAYLHHDAVGRRLRARRGARLAAITSGGAIPDTADYQVVLEPSGTPVGSVNEDFAFESMTGDIFQLGNASWRILRIEPGKLRVEDARGALPNIPFWLGEAPGRTFELSAAVSRLREEISVRLGGQRGKPAGTERSGSDPEAPNSPVDPGSAGTAAVRSERDPAPAASFPRTDATDAMEIEGRRTQFTTAGSTAPGGAPVALSWLTGEVGIELPAAEQIVDYMAAVRKSLGAVPTQRLIVLERFFDETGGMQLIVHSPFGSRLNRAWGLALRKRFCRKFNLELQAAATEDGIVLSLGPCQSFPLDEVTRYLSAATVREILTQALLDAPMFSVRWRWNTTRALAVLRHTGGRRVAPQLQRFLAEDLLALVFPDQLACAENIEGEREIPDHPLVAQTIADCLEEAMDIRALESLLARIERGDVEVLARDVTEPSPLALEILGARPYAFLDDAPIEERRTQAVASRRWLDAETASDLGALDSDAIARVREESAPAAETADELHDALVVLGYLPETGAAPAWRPLFEELTVAGRAARLFVRPAETIAPCPASNTDLAGGGTTPAAQEQSAAGDAGPDLAAGETAPVRSESQDLLAAARSMAGNGPVLWIAAERLAQIRAALPGALVVPPIEPPRGFEDGAGTRTGALVEILRSRLETLGPVTVDSLAAEASLAAYDVEATLAALESEGFVMRGRFTPGANTMEWCARRLLARIHRYTLDRLRREIEPVTAADFIRFLFTWQHLAQPDALEGPAGLSLVLEQLEGFDAPAAAWEEEILPARTVRYDPAWIDALCLSGRIGWARRRPTRPAARDGRGAALIRTTPVALLQRKNLPLWDIIAQEQGEADPSLTSGAGAVLEWLRARGACFFEDIVGGTGLLRSQVEDALGELVASGVASSDSFAGLRALLTPTGRRSLHAWGRKSRAGANPGMENAGRWALIASDPGRGGNAPPPAADDTAAGPLTRDGYRAAVDARGGGHEGRHRTDGNATSSAEVAVRGRESRTAVEMLAHVLLRRYGVVFHRVLERENLTVPWRDLLRVYRRLEARGELRGGRFVEGFTGEQYALPQAVGALRATRRRPASGALVSVSAADPLNLAGILTPGARLPVSPANRLLYRDGVPIAVFEAGEVRDLVPMSEAEAWQARGALMKRPFASSSRS